MILETLTQYVSSAILKHLPGAVSIIIHGSVARNEGSLYSNREYDILLGNIGFTIITDSPTKDRLLLPFLLRFLRNIDTSDLRRMIDKPLILLKPFEISLISHQRLLQGDIPPDIWVYEMVNAGKIVYGENLLSLFKTHFDKYAGLKIIVNRLFGLNLCIPLILRSDFNSKINLIAVNYESVKGILAALEALLVLQDKYYPSYYERGKLIDVAVRKFADFFSNPQDTIETFKLATKLELDTMDIDEISPTIIWFQSRSILKCVLSIYSSNNINLERVYRDRTTSKIPYHIKEALRFLLNNRFDPRIFTIYNLDRIATNLMYSCVFSMKQTPLVESSKYKSLICLSRYANFLHTRGQWQDITDNIIIIHPRARIGVTI